MGGLFGNLKQKKGRDIDLFPSAFSAKLIQLERNTTNLPVINTIRETTRKIAVLRRHTGEEKLSAERR